MSELDRMSPQFPRRPAWPAALVVWALLGVLALLAGGIGAYYSTRTVGGSAPASNGAFVFRVHATPRPVPELAFEDGEGRKRLLAEFRGKLVLLNVWATWCAPCRKEMPALDRLQQKLGGAGLEVIALSIDRGGPAAVRRFYDEIGIKALRIYIDQSGEASFALGVNGIPATLLIDQAGRELRRKIGPAEWDSPQIVKLISGYLSAPVPYQPGKR